MKNVQRQLGGDASPLMAVYIEIQKSPKYRSTSISWNVANDVGFIRDIFTLVEEELRATEQ